MAGENPQTTMPPVPREPLIGSNGRMSSQWERWIQQIQRVLSFSGGIAWQIVNKAGAKLSDLPERTHAMLQSVLGWSSTADTAQDKHISDANGKKWEDHVNITDGNPHGTNWDMLEETASEIPFNITAPGATNTEGMVRWNPAEKCLEYVTGLGSVEQVNKDIWELGVNKTGGTAVDGKCVYASGVQGHRLTYQYADAREAAKSALVGVVTASTANNAEGPITAWGMVHGVDTSAWAEGTKLYIAADATGTLTSTAPPAPNYRIWVATVVDQHITQGSIFVAPRIDHGNGITFNSLDVLSLLTSATARFGTATDNTTFEADGTAKFNGAATVWKDIFFPMAPPKTTGAGNPTLTTWNGNLRGYAFAVNDTHDFDPQEFVHDGKEGSTANWHIHFVSRTNVAAARAVKFQIEYTQANRLGVFPAPTTTSVEITIPANTAVNTHFIEDISTFTTGQIAGQMCVKLTRIAAAGTAPATDPVVLGVHYHYEVDTVGSRQIFTK